MLAGGGVRRSRKAVGNHCRAVVTGAHRRTVASPVTRGRLTERQGQGAGRWGLTGGHVDALHCGSGPGPPRRCQARCRAAVGNLAHASPGKNTSAASESASMDRMGGSSPAEGGRAIAQAQSQRRRGAAASPLRRGAAASTRRRAVGPRRCASAGRTAAPLPAARRAPPPARKHWMPHHQKQKCRVTAEYQTGWKGASEHGRPRH